MSILILPLALVLGGPFMFGVLTTSTWLYFKLRKRATSQTALTVVFVMLAILASIMTAPYWVVGQNGWLLSVGAYVLFVALGVPKFTKLMRFLKLELDGDDSNDPQLPGDDAKSAKK